MNPVLSAESLSVGYGKKIILEHLDFALHPGEILTLIGANGAGKSTLLKTVSGQLPPISGAVFLENQKLASVPGKILAKKMALVLTQRIDPELMTCFDVVASGRYPYTGRFGILSETDKSKIREAMRMMSLTELSEREFSQISDGQRQRVMLARAVCQEPEVLLLDEPTSFLDIRHKLELLSLIRRLVREKQIAVMMSLHELDLAQKVSDRVLCMKPGERPVLDTPEAIFTDKNIMDVFQVSTGSYQAYSGALELKRPEGRPEIFVIGGGGKGTPIYRQLQRKNIPFATGIIYENDLDYPVAKALAAEVISEQAFEPVQEETLQKALQIMQSCQSVICCPITFGTLNQANQRLAETARKAGKISETNQNPHIP